MSTNSPGTDRPQYEPARRLNDALQLLLTIGATLTATVAIIKKSPWIAGAAGVVVIASVAWVVARRTISRRRRQPAKVVAPPAGGGAYLRGLLPFEKGEQLLGRGQDARQLLAKLRSGACRFAYVSGEAGAGKTSLLRSSVVQELETTGFIVIYCDKTGADPVAAALRALRKAVFDAPISNGMTLLEALSAAHRVRGDRLILIWDQFEEFFISRRVKQEREEILSQIGAAYADETIPVRFVVSLRKEFVDDLQDFAPWVAQPLDVRFSHRLRSWDPEQAAAVLTAAAEHDEVPFADKLKEQLIRDLETAGEVRPVELQLVASRLAEQRIYDLDRYREVGGAQGILTSYVNEIVVPTGRQSDEPYQRVARVVLRLLCADSADAKRPIGLAYDELVQRVAASVSDLSADAVQQLVSDCLDLAVRAYVVILEDEERYNLRHDYLARSIYEATAGLQTIEQRANRLLESYIALERTGRTVVIPWREFRLIRRYATPQRKGELAARTIISRSRRRYALALVLGCLSFIVLCTVLPPRIELPKTTIDLVDQQWIISANNLTAASFKADGPTRIWNVAKPWASALPVDIPMRGLRIAENGAWIAGITKEGAVYVWPANKRLTRATTPTLQIVPPKEGESYWSNWGGVTAAWAYAFSGDGKLYLWRPSEILPANATHMAAFAVTSDRKDEKGGRPFERLPEIAFSADGTYVAVGDGRGILWVKRLLSFSEPPVTLNDLHTWGFNDAGAFAFTPSGRRLIYEGSNNRLHAADLAAFPRLVVTHTVHDESTFVRQVQAVLSPNEEQLVYRFPFNSFHEWRVSENVDVLPPSFILTGRKTQSDRDPSLRMSNDGRWLGGRGQDGAIYVWATNASPGTVVKPVLKDGAEGTAVDFNKASDRVAMAAGNGQTFVVTPGSTPDLKEPVAGLPSDVIAMRWSIDGEHLYCSSGGDLFFGDVAANLELILRAKSPVQHIVTRADGSELVVFTEHQLTFVRRRWTLWHFLPVKSLQWPAPVSEARTLFE